MSESCPISVSARAAEATWTTNPGRPRGAEGGRGAAVGGAGLGGAQNPTAASVQACSLLGAAAAPGLLAPLRPRLPPCAPAAGHRDARARATGRSAGAGDEREEPT